MMPLSIAGQELQIFAWNGQGICLFNPSDRLRMGTTVSILQKIVIMLAFKKFMATWLIFYFHPLGGYLGG